MTAISKTRERLPWGLLVLLIVAMTVNFLDRGNLPVAAPVLSPELGFTPWRTGILLSAFFWTYVISQLAGGSLVDRIEVRWVYAVGYFLWSAATLFSGIWASFAGLLTMRLLLGVGASVAYPATSRVLAAVVPERRRGLANALVDLGARLGPAAGTMGGALLVAHFGWRSLFLIAGGAGMIWLVPWLIVAPRQLVAGQKPGGGTGPGWKQLLGRRAVWGTCGGLCGANYAWYFLLNWLPSYLVRERHFSMRSLAFWGAMPYLCMAVSSVSGGILADRWVGRGASPVKVRRGFLVTGLALTALFLPLVLIPSREFGVAGLMLACFAFGIYASNLFSLTQTLSGPEAAGRWTGLQNACGNVAGILSPAIAGWLVQETGSFASAFVAASIACLLGSASFGLLVRESDSPRGLIQAQGR